MPKTILKVIVGSQAHGLATPDSDYDYRGVFVTPTREILSLGHKPQQTSWIEGKDDDTSWEIGHFLNLAVHCNPTILETFCAPVKEETEEGEQLRKLFSVIWNPTRVRDAFKGYGYNQRKKFLEEKDSRGPKYAVAYLRTLYQAHYLLRTGELVVDISSHPVYDTLKRWKSWAVSEIDYGEVISECKSWEATVDASYEWHMEKVNQQPDLEKVNDLLIMVRVFNWI